MFPLITTNSLFAVDTQVNDRKILAGKIVLASHRDLGFKVAHLQRLPSVDLLVSVNHRYLPVDITSDSQWKIVGQVLWWMSKDPQA